jgi:hypothetical protein
MIKQMLILINKVGKDKITEMLAIGTIRQISKKDALTYLRNGTILLDEYNLLMDCGLVQHGGNGIVSKKEAYKKLFPDKYKNFLLAIEQINTFLDKDGFKFIGGKICRK